MRKVVIQTSLFTVLIGLIIYFIGRIKEEWLHIYQWSLVAYFYLLTMISLIIVERTAKRNINNISKGFFGAMMLRLFLSVIIAVIVIYLDRKSSTIFAINFIVLYLLFLGFEIYYLINFIQPRFDGGEKIE